MLMRGVGKGQWRVDEEHWLGKAVVSMWRRRWWRAMAWCDEGVGGGRFILVAEEADNILSM